MTIHIRKRVAELLEANRDSDAASRTVDIFLIGLIALNVAAIIMETVPAIQARFGRELLAFEIFSVIVFSSEYLLRLWSCVDREHGRFRHPLRGRVRWAFSPLGLIDLAAILPFYVLMLVPGSSQSFLILRLVRGIRLLRIFKLTRYSPAFQILVSVMRKEGGTLAVAGFILMMVLVIASWGIYILEKEAQPEVFGHIPAAMWWAVVSLTTVGYGDVVPVTNGGKFFAGLLAIVGIGMVAVPAGILASGFSSEVRRRTDTYNRALESALADGIISITEAKELAQLREDLGINEEEAKVLLLDAQRKRHVAAQCPHCGKSIRY